MAILAESRSHSICAPAGLDRLTLFLLAVMIPDDPRPHHEPDRQFDERLSFEYQEPVGEGLRTTSREEESVT